MKLKLHPIVLSGWWEAGWQAFSTAIGAGLLVDLFGAPRWLLIAAMISGGVIGFFVGAANRVDTET